MYLPRPASHSIYFIRELQAAPGWQGHSLHLRSLLLGKRVRSAPRRSACTFFCGPHKFREANLCYFRPQGHGVAVSPSAAQRSGMCVWRMTFRLWRAALEQQRLVLTVCSEVCLLVSGICWVSQTVFCFQVVQDWKFVAQVLDRMFLWAFLLVSILGSALLFIPVIYKWASIIVPNHETMVFGD